MLIKIELIVVNTEAKNAETTDNKIALFLKSIFVFSGDMNIIKTPNITKSDKIIS